MQHAPTNNQRLTYTQVVRIALAVASVLLLRYSPHASRTYDEKVDNVPRIALLLPPFILSLVSWLALVVAFSDEGCICICRGS
jgi:hypothetical protein